MSTPESTISRKDARILGLVYYFTGLPCIHGHVAKRRVTTAFCSDCGRSDKLRAYYRAYALKRRRDPKLRAEAKRIRDTPEAKAAARDYARRYNQTPAGKLLAHKKHLRRRYGLTLGQYDALLLAQHGQCAICASTVAGKNGQKFAVDHDHKCCPGPQSCGRCIRGLLCRSCNALLGHARDSLVVLDAAKFYLQRGVQCLK